MVKNMFRISILFIVFQLSLFAKSITANYSVEFGIIGEVAKADATLTSDHAYYTIDAHVEIVGSIAKVVTDNLKEHHISKGHMENGLLVTDMYQMIKSYGEYTSTTIYQSDHKRKRLTRWYRKWKNGSKIIDRKVKLSYYGKDDMMTLFLNLPKYIKNKETPHRYIFSVVGADRKNGRVDVAIPSGKASVEMKSLLGRAKEGEWLSSVIMHRKLYNSKKGELSVKIAQDGIVDKAVLKDLLFFGDVRILRR